MLPSGRRTSEEKHAGFLPQTSGTQQAHLRQASEGKRPTPAPAEIRGHVTQQESPQHSRPRASVDSVVSHVVSARRHSVWTGKRRMSRRSRKSVEQILVSEVYSVLVSLVHGPSLLLMPAMMVARVKRLAASVILYVCTIKSGFHYPS